MGTATALALAWVALSQLQSAALGQQECGHVFLTVSSLWNVEEPRGVSDRQLELNWDPSCPPDWVALYDKEPPLKAQFHGTGEALAAVRPSEHPDGFVRTTVGLGRPALPGGWERPPRSSTAAGHNPAGPTPDPGDHCLPFWVAAYRGGRRLHAQCLMIRPTWMWDNRQHLGQLPLASLFLPGTHNSGCYHKSSGVTRRDTFARYLLTQDTDVWGQLVHGIRYLDVRVGYYPARGGSPPGPLHSSRFWVNHDLLRVGPLLPVLHDLKRFLNKSSGEVVILDLHRFPVGFHGRPGRHRKLVSLLVRELGPYIVPKAAASADTTLAQLWTRDRRLIIAYGDKTVARESKWLWGPINQMWGNQQTPGGLKNYLQKAIDSNRQRPMEQHLWAAMAELTPTPLEVMFKPTGSLRQMADMVNRNVSTWFRTLWWQKTNIVATDFFLGNDIINIAVAANLRKMNLVEAR